MSALARAWPFALVLTLTALVLHPGLRSEAWPKQRALVLAVLVALAALALVSRAASAVVSGRVGELLVAAGGLALVAAVGTDGVRGHHGSLALVAGQVTTSFDERGLAGKPLGLRPLGFSVECVRVEADGGAALAFAGESGTRELTPRHALAFSGFRFARLREATTGGIARLRVGVGDGRKEQVVDLGPGRPGRAGDLTITLADYFPDFALDAAKQPFSRSTEHRNPAALVTVERGDRSYRAFVIRSMPGIHRVEDLGLSFSLLDVEPERSAEIDVHREPAALLAGFAALLIVVGLGASLAERDRIGPLPPSEPAARTAAGSALVAFLLVADRGSVLHWSFGVSTAEGRVLLPGVGVVLGAALVASLGGVLLLVAQGLAGPGSEVRKPARLLLGAGAGLGAVGGLVAVIQLVRLTAGIVTTANLPVAGLLVTVGLVALSVRPGRPGEGVALAARLFPLLLPLAVLLTVIATLAAGVLGVVRDGTYATDAVSALAATALIGLAGLEPSRFATGCRLAFLVSLLTLTLR